MNVTYSSRPVFVLALALLTALPGSFARAAGSGDEATIATSLRLSPSQYKLIIGDIFGDSVKIDGRFEPEQRDQGLLAIGARTTNITDSGLESYDGLAQNIAAQVVDARHRETLIECKPHSNTSRDDACARTFLERVGLLAHRRPLTEVQLNERVAVAGMAADKLQDFYGGLRQSLSEILISPEFLFRFKRVEPDPAHPGAERMDVYDKASEISFFLWNTMPDEELMQAAKDGQLNSQAGLQRQVNRMAAMPRVADGIRAFFADMLGFGDFGAVSKDPNLFPLYTPKIPDQAQEQTLRTIVDHISNRHADYRDLFTTPRTYLTRDLAALYNVPLLDTTDNGQPQRWIPYTYPADDPRAGILSQASFTTLWSPAGRTSPTVRGKALRQNILCQKVPPPPGNVSFKFVEDTSDAQLKTTRARLTAHRTEAMCAGCHKLTDPLGLALENFDSAGEFRMTENGERIDVSGEVNGKAFSGPQGLGQAVHDDPAATSCVAQRVFASETGYLPPKDDERWHQIMQKFEASRFDVVELLRAIALSDLSYDRSTHAPFTAVNR